MTAISATVLSSVPQLRPLNIVRDLPRVADLVEKCFADTMDAEGRNYIQQMRRAGMDNAFLRWASTAVDSVSMPLSGYVWEENGEIIGNVSLIPYRHSHQKYYLVANVAVKMEYRRKGIGRALTIAAMQHARQHNAYETWLHVRADNPGAIDLYRSLGFIEMARRTTWQAAPDRNAIPTAPDIEITPRSPHDWSLQVEWLRRLYPVLMDWYQSIPWMNLRPGLWPTVYRFLSDVNVNHWVARTGNSSTAILSWQANMGRNDPLWAAVPFEGSDSALTALLQYARRALPWRQKLSLDFPAGEYQNAIEMAGFRAYRTLLWMKDGETPGVNKRTS